jgi:hypothetical protein
MAWVYSPSKTTARAQAIRDLTPTLPCGPARIWVRLVGSGELRRRLAEDSRLSLVGVVVPYGAGFAATQGVDAAEGGAGLDGQGFHVDVAYSHLEQ